MWVRYRLIVNRERLEDARDAVSQMPAMDSGVGESLAETPTGERWVSLEWDWYSGVAPGRLIRLWRQDRRVAAAATRLRGWASRVRIKSVYEPF